MMKEEWRKVDADRKAPERTAENSRGTLKADIDGGRGLGRHICCIYTRVVGCIHDSNARCSVPTNARPLGFVIAPLSIHKEAPSGRPANAQTRPSCASCIH